MIPIRNTPQARASVQVRLTQAGLTGVQQPRIPSSHFIHHHINSDGDCLFRAMHMGLNQPGEYASHQQVMDLRQRLANYIEHNQQTLETNPFFQSAQGVSDLYGLLLSSGQWNENAGDLVAPLLAQVLGREVVVLQPEGTNTYTERQTFHPENPELPPAMRNTGEPPIYLAHLGGTHYEYLEHCDTNTQQQVQQPNLTPTGALPSLQKKDGDDRLTREKHAEGTLNQASPKLSAARGTGTITSHTPEGYALFQQIHADQKPAAKTQLSKLALAVKIRNAIVDLVTKQYQAGGVNTQQAPEPIRAQYNLWRIPAANDRIAQRAATNTDNTLSDTERSARLKAIKGTEMADVATWLNGLKTFYTSGSSPFTEEEKSGEGFEKFINTITPLSPEELAQPEELPTRGQLHRYLNSSRFDATPRARLNYLLNMSEHEANFVQAMNSDVASREKAILVRGISPPQIWADYQCTAGAGTRLQEAKDALSMSPFLNAWNNIKTETRSQALGATYEGNQVHLSPGSDLIQGVPAKAVLASDDNSRLALRTMSANKLWQKFQDTLNLGPRVKTVLTTQSRELVLDNKENPTTSVTDNKNNTYLKPLGLDFQKDVMSLPLDDRNPEVTLFDMDDDSDTWLQWQGKDDEAGAEQLSSRIRELMFRTVSIQDLGEKNVINWRQLPQEDIAWDKLDDSDPDKLPSANDFAHDKGREWIISNLSAPAEGADQTARAEAALHALFIYSEDTLHNRPAMTLRVIHELGGLEGIEGGKKVLTKLSEALSANDWPGHENLGKIVDAVAKRCEHYCQNSMLVTQHNNRGLKEYADFLQTCTQATGATLVPPILAMSTGGASSEELCHAIAKASPEAINQRNPNNAQNILWIAAKDGQTDVVKALIDSGHLRGESHVPIGDQDNKGKTITSTPLETAILRNRQGVFDALIQDKAVQATYKTPRRNDQKNVLMLAASEKRGPMFTTLVEQFKDLQDDQGKPLIDAVDSNGTSVLDHVVKSGTADQLKQLVDAGCDIRKDSYRHGSVLNHATHPDNPDRTNRAEKLEIILQSLNKLPKQEYLRFINTSDQYGYSALDNAARSGDVEQVKQLIKAGAEINASGHNDMSPLHFAILSGSVECAKALLAKGGDIRKGSLGGSTAFHFAVESKGIACLDLLLTHFEKQKENNPDYTYKRLLSDPSNERKTLLTLAAKAGNSEAITRLLQIAKNHNVDYGQLEFEDMHGDGRCALHYAAVSGNAECITALAVLNTTPSWNAKGEIPLELAIINNHPDAMDALVKHHGVNLQEAAPIEGNPILHWAIKHHKTGVAERILQHSMTSKGVDINQQNDQGETPLILAALEGHSSLVKQILELPDIDPSITSPSHGNAFFAALANNNSNITTALLFPALYICSTDNKINLQETYQGTNTSLEKGKSLLHIAVERNDAVLARALLSQELNQLLPKTHTININQVDRMGRSPLHDAAEAGNNALIEILLANGADFNQKIDVPFTTRKSTSGFTARLKIPNGQGQTALHRAARNGHDDVINTLVNKMNRREIDERDTYGQNALMKIVKAENIPEDRINQCANTLLKCGAKPDTQDKRLRTVQGHATHASTTQIIKRALMIAKQHARDQRTGKS